MIGTKLQCIKYLESLPEGQYEVKEHRQKRSLNANGYYWSLLGQLAKVMKISSTRIHNENLRKLGLVERIDGRVVTLALPDTDEAEMMVIESDTYHLKPTSQVRTGRDGVVYRTYVMLRGSSTFDKQEFSALLDFLIQDCQEQDIETITPQQKAEMMERYGVQIEKSKSN